MSRFLGRLVDRANATLVAGRTRSSSARTSASTAGALAPMSTDLFGRRAAADALTPELDSRGRAYEIWADRKGSWEALRNPAGDRGAPALIVLHGWLAVGLQRLALQSFMRPLRRSGMDVWYPWLPAHGSRTRAGYVSGAECLSSDLPGTAKAIAQGVVETVELAEWLRARGQSVSIVGFSLGGWIAGLAATEWSHFHRVALFTPVSDPARSFAESPLVAHIRADLAAAQITSDQASELLASVSLCGRDLATPRERVLLIGATEDNVIAEDSLELLARRWNCRLEWVGAGHITSQWTPSARRLARDWLRSVV
ncbi:MAG: hypothetical protein GKS06_10585 [Acidobacteria bacterium]|nr:hypothetical protein [Acidobacteriota bacterium]